MKIRSLALAASLLLVAGSAGAANTVDLVWQSTMSPTINPSVSQTVIADIVLTADATGVSGMGISLAYDAVELQAAGALEFSSVNLPGMGNVFAPLGPGVEVDNINGVITRFDQADLTGLGLVSGTATVGTVRFHVEAIVADGVDVLGNADGLVDGFVNSVGGGLPDPTFNGLTVPEPGAASLGAAALAALLALKRRRA